MVLVNTTNIKLVFFEDRKGDMEKLEKDEEAEKRSGKRQFNNIVYAT